MASRYPWRNTWPLVHVNMVVVYSPLAYQHQAFSTVVTIECISITDYQ